MGYYDGRDIPYYWNVAKQYVLFDRFFGSTRGGQPGELPVLGGRGRTGEPEAADGSAGYDTLPTIFDRLAAKKRLRQVLCREPGPRTLRTGRRQDRTAPASWSRCPLLSMKRFQNGGPLAGTVVDLSEYYRDLRDGTLPAVSYIVTRAPARTRPAAWPRARGACAS